MARPAQALAGWCKRVFLWVNPRVSPCAFALLLLSGCATGGFSLENAAVDRSVETSSVTPGPASGGDDTVKLSDEVTIRNAVSSAIVDEVGADGIGWANAETGSRGAIREVSETREKAGLCRAFTASRESFEGVHLYRGVTCLGEARVWVMRSFERVR